MSRLNFYIKRAGKDLPETKRKILEQQKRNFGNYTRNSDKIGQMAKARSEIRDLTEKIIRFRDARDWRQFHNPKDVSLSLVLEASEVMEHFQWKSPEEIKVHIKKGKSEIAGELADVLYWILLMSHDLKINIISALHKKLKQNERRYSVAKSKGKHNKYNEL